MRVGGPAARVIEPTTEIELIDATRHVWRTDDWLLLGGGSNVVVSDEGFEGTVIRVVTRGIEVVPGGGARLRVQAGEPWDAVVQYAVERGWAGIEALSGIPGSTGAAPIQNIGAYGQELASSLVAVDLLTIQPENLFTCRRRSWNWDTAPQLSSAVASALWLRSNSR